MPISLVIADDHEVVRVGLRAWFAGTDFAVVGEAANGIQAIELVESLAPQLLLVDVSMPALGGLECLGRLRDRSKAVPTLVMSDNDNVTYAARAAALGALGFVLKSIDRAALLDVCARAAAGESVWEPQLVRRFTGSMATPNGDGSYPVGLTGREVEVLTQLSYGLSNKEIAEALCISYETVKEHVQHILRKLAVADRTQAAVWAVRNGVA
jgi:DNA-binding NarL/FixJ family response regulator